MSVHSDLRIYVYLHHHSLIVVAVCLFVDMSLIEWMNRSNQELYKQLHNGEMYQDFTYLTHQAILGNILCLKLYS